LGTFSAFAFRHKENKENLCRDASLKQTWKLLGFVRDIEGEMSHAKTPLVQSLAVIGCHIDLTNRGQNFACQGLGRL